MEFRLNKIDTELRQIVNDSTKEGIVHGNKETTRISEEERERKHKEQKEEFQKELSKRQKDEKNRFQVQAEKIEKNVKEKTVEIQAVKENVIEDYTRGRFLNTKR